MSETNRTEALKLLDRKIGWQRLFMGFEGLWAALQWPLVVLAIAVAAVASGILGHLPAWSRVVLAALLAAAFLWSLRAVLKYRAARRREAMRKLEVSARVGHRPVSSADDALAAEIMDPRAEALWDEHHRRQLATLDGLRVVPPQSRWRDVDPRALRVPVALGLVAALLLGPGNLTQNLGEAMRLMPAPPPVPLTLDAWLKPPAYTGRPPILLTSPQMQEKLAAGGTIEVPENATLTLRLSGGNKPAIRFEDAPQQDNAGLKVTSSEAALTAEAPITAPVTVVVENGGQALARWPIVTLPDKNPTLELTETPAGDGRGNLSVKWKATDDYGLKRLSGEIELSDEQEGGTGFESNGVFLFTPPELKFVLKRGKAKEEAGTSRFDVAKHPWAGLMVTLNMKVEDAAGHTAAIEPVTFKLPERTFVKPLPRALIEQRKTLILYPERANFVGTMVDALALYPKGLFEGATPVIAMTAIASRLRNAAGYDDVNLAINDLWDLAVKLEEGALSDLKAELKSLKEELEKALREGAPPERIAELMDRLRKTMDQYLDAMREETERRMADGTMPQNGQQQQQGREITRDELQKMLDALEEMSKQGNTDMAQQLLNELDRMLQNLEPGQGQQSAEGDSQMDQMMQGLGNLMRRQQRLMDDTQRMGEGEEPGQQGEGSEGQQQGQQGQGRRGQGQGEAGDDLAEQQKELRRMLEEMTQGNGDNLPGALGQAGEAMEGAEQALRDGDREGALQRQGEAMENLRRGAQELAQQMRDRGQGREGGQAREGEGRGGEEDPLGRPRATRNPDDGPEKDMVPSERAMQRAREILEQLREKANREGLTDSERAYIERLMRGQF